MKWSSERARPFAVSEDVEGQTLQTSLLRGRRFPVAEACRIGHQVAQALTHLHIGQLLHLALQPSEIVLQSSGHVKLLRQPFLVPRPSPDPSGSTSQRLAAADYAAPELGRMNTIPDARADIYALGCTLYELLTGDVPFPGGDAASKRQRHAQEPVRPLEESLPVPGGLSDVLSFMLAKDRSKRYQDAAEVASRLERFLDHSRRPTQARPRPTEVFYLAQLRESEEPRPRHLRDSKFDQMADSASVTLGSSENIAAASEDPIEARPSDGSAAPPLFAIPGQTRARKSVRRRSPRRWILLVAAGVLLTVTGICAVAVVPSTS